MTYELPRFHICKCGHDITDHDFRKKCELCKCKIFSSVTLLECLRCGGKWPAKKKNPRACQRCGTTLWNRPKVPFKEINQIF